MAQVHLTFDNGPHPEGTPLVLDSLARWGHKATFFVLGHLLNSQSGRRLAERARDEGHRLGNHSWSHTTPLGLDPRPDAVFEEMERTQRLLDTIWSGQRWFRPFGGGGVLGPHLLSRASVDWLVAGGHTCALWTSVPGDWLHEDWVARALEDVQSQAHVVLVLHDILPGAMAHLEAFFEALSDGGHTTTDAWPASCLPIVNGQVQPGAHRYIQGDGHPA